MRLLALKQRSRMKDEGEIRFPLPLAQPIRYKRSQRFLQSRKNHHRYHQTFGYNLPLHSASPTPFPLFSGLEGDGRLQAQRESR